MGAALATHCLEAGRRSTDPSGTRISRPPCGLQPLRQPGPGQASSPVLRATVWPGLVGHRFRAVPGSLSHRAAVWTRQTRPPTLGPHPTSTSSRHRVAGAVPVGVHLAHSVDVSLASAARVWFAVGGVRLRLHPGPGFETVVSPARQSASRSRSVTAPSGHPPGPKPSRPQGAGPGPVRGIWPCPHPDTCRCRCRRGPDLERLGPIPRAEEVPSRATHRQPGKTSVQRSAGRY